MQGQNGDYEYGPVKFNSLTFSYKYGGTNFPVQLTTEENDIHFSYKKILGEFSLQRPSSFFPLEVTGEMKNIKTPYRCIESWMGIGLKEKVVNHHVKFDLGYFGFGYEKVGTVDVKAVRMTGLRGGIRKTSSCLELWMYNSIEKNVKYFTNYSNTNVFIGLFWAKYLKYKIEAEGKKRSAVRLRVAYLDLFYLADDNIGAEAYTNTEGEPSPKLIDAVSKKDNFNTRNVGVRFGTSLYSKRMAGASLKCEVGVLSGTNTIGIITGKTVYFANVGVGLNITARSKSISVEGY